MHTYFYNRSSATQLLLLSALLIGLSSPINADAEGLGSWLKDRATKITKGVGNVVDKAVKETINGNGNETSIHKNTQLSRREVAELQSRLNSLGYSVGTADGVAGPKTYRAISTYEQEQGLPVTGSPSVTVLASLRQHSVYTSENKVNDEPHLVNNRSAGGGLLKPTATSKGAVESKGIATIQANIASGLPTKVIVPGDDFFKPLAMPMFNGIPVTSETIFKSSLLNYEKLYFKLLLGKDFKGKKEYAKQNSWVGLLAAVREEHQHHYGSCLTRKHHYESGRDFSTVGCKLNGKDEFQRKRAVDKFNAEVVERFYARSPSLPKYYYSGGFAELGKYDFDHQTLKLHTYNGTRMYRDYHNKPTFPEEMSMSPDVAESLLNTTHKLYWLIKFTSDGHHPIGEINYYTTDTYETLFKTVPFN